MGSGLVSGVEECVWKSLRWAGARALEYRKLGFQGAKSCAQFEGVFNSSNRLLYFVFFSV
jgi:hypothetical protein